MDTAVKLDGSAKVARRWYEETDAARIYRAFRRHPDIMISVLIAVVTIAVYLFTSSRDPQNLDYFVRLADAFLHGRIYLTEAPSWLNELIPKDGVFYVAYPPMPAVVLAPFVAIWGLHFPQQVASCLFGGISVGLAYLVFGLFALRTRVRLLLTLVFGFGTVLWHVSEVGSVWYLSHSTAVMFSLLALVFALRRRMPFAVGLFLGAAAISRLPVGLTAPFYLGTLLDLGWPPKIPLDRIATLRRTLLFGAGLAIPAGAYLLYNLARWGSVVDESYVLIPGVLQDPIYANYGILSIFYIPRHIYAIFLRSWNYVDDPPFFQPSLWGLSLFFTTPLYLWLAKARLRDPLVLWAVVGIGLTLIPIVTHGNVGISQFGYRFSLDFQPLMFVILATVFARGMSRPATIAAGLSIGFCAYAIWAISIGFTAY
jgi:hypothetical protein